MIERDIMPRLVELFDRYPFVTVTGPRQSGKTTLCRETFPGLKYVNLEAPDQREFAESDPRGLLATLDGGAILDEIQRVPELLSYLQVFADERGHNGLFVLTGSEHFKLSEAISQSLAGRTALLRLLPFSLAERQRSGADNRVDEILYAGFYPRIYDQGLEPRQALSDYFETYVERDVRRLGEIRNLSSFQRFVRLCAGRIGQLTNTVALGSDAGVSHTTARNWIEVLEASYIAFRLPPFHANIRKRLVKSPKLYFYDVGLASHLIGIEHVEQVATHPLRGALFENMMVVEALKHRYNRGRQHNLSFFRDSRGLECDLLFESGQDICAIEIKSGATIASDYFDVLESIAKSIPGISAKVVVYGGTVRQPRSAGEVIPYSELSDHLARFETDQEMAEFVKDRLGLPSDESDEKILDRVYHTHIRPLIEELQTPLQKHVAQLFSYDHSFSQLDIGHLLVGLTTLPNADEWEHAKKSHIVKRGFKLNDRSKLAFSCQFNFQGYSGRGDAGTGLVLSIRWTLGAEAVSREVTINESSFASLGARIPYADMDAGDAQVDRIVSGILRGVMTAIESPSGGR
ncbi:MAG: ATP-binding protein [Rhodospirillales bacterium]|nr:ATP-binding protein [Rhodospirillales bacterium]MDE0380130.1 ATP-binding protein [Rhodospirillales bacterium]